VSHRVDLVHGHFNNVYYAGLLAKWELRKMRESSRSYGQPPPYCRDPELQLDYSQEMRGYILQLPILTLNLTIPTIGFWNS